MFLNHSFLQRCESRSATELTPDHPAPLWLSASLSRQQWHSHDGGKLVKGHKRHILVDTLGLWLQAIVSAANVTESWSYIIAGENWDVFPTEQDFSAGWVMELTLSLSLVWLSSVGLGSGQAQAEGI